MMTSSTFLYDSESNRVQTGAEKTIAYRTGEQWAKVAKQAGTVLSIDKDIVHVEYEDGTHEYIEIGKQFGVWSGAIIPHENLSMFKVGDKFEKDDILTYNKHYFEKDPLNRNRVLFKRGIRGTMVLWEDIFTLEDSSQISKSFAERLATGDTIKRSVKVPFDHSLELLVKEGDTVNTETILCNLRPPMSGMGNKYSADAQAALDILNTMAPAAKTNGVIDKIEVMYSGEIEHMEPTLQEIVSEADAKLYRRNKKLNVPVKSAYVSPTYRIDGVDVGEDQVVIVFYITSRVGASVGDKLVYGHQLKSIIGSVIEEPHVAEDGTVIDISFGRQSIANRIVNSIDLVSTTNTLLGLMEKEMIEAYFNK